MLMREHVSSVKASLVKCLTERSRDNDADATAAGRLLVK
jgi:GntR family transcriptional regulator, vanillate catabolism transcriptional regulator